jgi:hypothetical protein
MVLNFANQQLNSLKPFDLSEIKGFPNSVYEGNKKRYAEMETWYDGTILEDQGDKSGKDVDIYPVRINPVRGAVVKHAAVLFGDVVDDGRPLVIPRMVPREGDEASKTMAADAEEALNMLWYENHGRAIQLRNGLLSQYLGGAVFKLTYVPEERWRTIPIRIELIHPKDFVATADASDFWRLRRGWIVRMVSKELAKEYGVDIKDESGWLLEDWSHGTYKVTIDGQLASKRIGGTKERRPLGGANPFGFVPMTYIPHTRTKDFWGNSLISGLEGLIKEINLRAADYGDAVSEDAHAWLAMRNVNGTPRVIELADGLKVVDLKSSPSVTGHESQPDIFSLKQASASEAMGKLWDRLYAQFRRDAHIPAVADGEDEGSQRSAMTLAFRMWPLFSHVTMERVQWTTGMNWFNTMALKMMAKPEIAAHMQKMGAPTITASHSAMRMRQDWAPMFPRDREGIINEIVARASAKAGSIETLLELAGDIEDIPAEKEKIVAWLKLLAEAETPPENDMSETNENDKPKPNAQEASQKNG